MKKFILSFLLLIIFLSISKAQSKMNLPPGALIIETQTVTPERTLILWMQNPQKNPRSADDTYSCPDYTRGSFYSGQANVSLVDSKAKKIINTLEIKSDEGDLPIPYLIERHYYKVPIVNAKKEGKPKILALQDFNGDGKAYEFAMYDALACMGLDTALFGYSEKQDKIIQYPIELKSGGETKNILWADYLFSKKPIAKGVWKYEIDYRGRGGTLDKYAIRYDRAGEKFVGTLNSENPK